MFEPTIKYKRVNEQSISKSPNNLTNSSNHVPSTPSEKTETKVNDSKKDENIKSTIDQEPKEQKVAEKIDEQTKEDTKKLEEATIKLDTFTFEEEEEEATIEVDPNDKDRIIVTLSTGKKIGADRYCPHAGVDLSTMGQVSEHDYPPEIGPVLMCTYHYWEFALEKGGRGAHNSTLNACPIEEGKPCPVVSEKKELEW